MGRSTAFAVAGAALCLSMPVQAYHIQGYAVGNHRTCGASNLPGTIAELNQFFGSEHFPADASKNFLWTDTGVKQVDWSSQSDYVESLATENGYDGVEAGLVSYIASHGVTSNAVYTALTGGRDNGGCNIRTSDMAAGDQSLRYLILSTCQGLKVGTGDRPTRPGENPSRTWESANRGLNCIYGYSNNMMDASEYGEYLLENLASTQESLSAAFFRASRSVSYYNIPAVLCFGENEEDARAHLEDDRNFSDEANGAMTSVFEYQDSRVFEAPDSLPLYKPFPETVHVRPAAIDPGKMAALLLGIDVAGTDLSNSFGARNGMESFSYNAQSGVIIYGRKQRNRSVAGKGLPDGEIVRVARDFIKKLKLGANIDLQLTHVIDTGYGNADMEAPLLVAKTAVFHQRLHGLLPLGARGSVEVTIDNSGEVLDAAVALVELAEASKGEWLSVSSSGILVDKATLARTIVQARFPDAQVRIHDVKFGYGLGNFSKLNRTAQAVVQVELEVTEGGFARRFLEQVNL